MPRILNCFLDDHIVDNHQVGFRAKKEKAQKAYPSLAGAKKSESKSVYVGGYFH